MLLGGQIKWESGESEAAVIAITRIGWIKFRQCGELFDGRKPSLKKRTNLSELGKVSDVVRSETGCLKASEMTILRRTETAMIGAMCGIKLIEKRSSPDLINLLGLEETLDRIAEANEM